MLRSHPRRRPRALAASALLDAFYAERAGGAPTVDEALAYLEALRRRARRRQLPVVWDLLDGELAGVDDAPFFSALRTALGRR